MRYGYSARLREDVNSLVQIARRSKGIVNVAAVAEDVRQRNLAENVALEDLEALVMQVAQLYGAAMEFDGLTAIDLEPFDMLPGKGAELAGNGKTDAIQDSAIPIDLRQPDQIQ